MVITLDGPSGTGKSTLAKLIAKKLKFKFLNSGMIYRAITYFLLSHYVLPTDVEAVSEIIDTLTIEIRFENDEQYVIVNGVDCTPFVSNREVQQNVSVYSQIAALRAVVLKLQHDCAKKNDIVIEGRDIGTAVFPKAEYKFYVECDLMVRSQRRFADLIKNDPSITLAQVQKSLEYRDYMDKTREHSPLIKPEDAVVIDTSNKTIDETLCEILNYIC